jgi:TP901 family phage tail tape measure protein
LGQAFKYAAPAAAAAGQSIEECGAAFSILANNGIKADMAGTSLRMMLMKLSDKGIQDNLLNMGIDV